MDKLIHFAGKDFSAESGSDPFDYARERFREFLLVNNLTFLFGTGSSIAVNKAAGKPSLTLVQMPSQILESIKAQDLQKVYADLKGRFESGKYKEKESPLEPFLAFLYSINTVGSHDPNLLSVKASDVGKLIKTIKIELVKMCANIPADDKSLLHHKHFLNRVLARPTTLPRVNLATVNYDLLFEEAMDDLGIVYVDGFSKGLRRFFKPETYNYDYYYPASTTEGRVHRMEKVLHYYKIHGSLNWIQSNDSSFNNIYGIEQLPSPPKDNVESILIYPTPMKETETLGFPYSDLFRRFANCVEQPQSVLITYGYSFGDEHINRIIRDAMSIPSFQLVVVSFDCPDNSPLGKFYQSMKEAENVSFVIGKEFAEWETFTKKILPDIPNSEIEEKVRERLAKAKKAERAMKDEAQDGE